MLYKWTKVDITNNVNAYFEESNTIQGKKLLEVKYFK